MVRKRWKRKRRNRRRKRWREMVIMSALGMKISRMYKGLLHIMVLAINTRFIRSAMERENRLCSRRLKNLVSRKPVCSLCW